MALTMVADTAGGKTQEQIINALNMQDIDMIRSETGKLFRQLYFHNEIGRLTFANSLWLNKDVAFNENKLKTLAEDYYAHSFSLNFQDKNSSVKISEWISENTGGKLGNDPSEFTLNKDQVMTLFTQIDYFGSAMPEGRADMILDRPFIFIITGMDKAPLFVGIINNPSL